MEIKVYIVATSDFKCSYSDLDLLLIVAPTSISFSFLHRPKTQKVTGFFSISYHYFAFPKPFITNLYSDYSLCANTLIVIQSNATTWHASNCITVNITKKRISEGGIPSCPRHKIGRAYGKCVYVHCIGRIYKKGSAQIGDG